MAKKDFTINEVDGFKIISDELPSGKYARKLINGHPESIFFYWGKFKKLLEKDKYVIESPVFKIYKNETFDKNIKASNRIGELRYKIK